jgi:hypothetical protein
MRHNVNKGSAAVVAGGSVAPSICPAREPPLADFVSWQDTHTHSCCAARQPLAVRQDLFGRYPGEVNRVVAGVKLGLMFWREDTVAAKSEKYVTNEQNMASSWLPFLSRIWEVLSSNLGSLAEVLRGFSSVRSSRRRDDILNLVTVVSVHSSISLFTNNSVIRRIWSRRWIRQE